MNDNIPNAPIWFTTEECAAYLSMPTETLLHWRKNAKGPPHHKFGRSVRYSKADVDAWTETCRRGKTA